jgi:hypothetical protein
MADGVKLEGAASKWDIVADNGSTKTHAFCPTCGSPVYLTFPARPQFFIVHAASLDDPRRYRPQAVTYAVRAPAWDKMDQALTRFEKMPPA